MDAKSIDKTVKKFWKNCSSFGHRSLFIIVGENAKFQIPALHHILGKGNTLSVLWCTKEYSKQSVLKNNSAVQPHQTAGTSHTSLIYSEFKPYYCCYRDINQLLGHSFNMAVLDDFEAVMPHVIASVAGTVKRGGMIVFLLKELEDVSQLQNFRMDFHKNFEVENGQKFSSRFNKRFVHFLNESPICAVLGNDLKVLKMSSKSAIFPVNPRSASDLAEFKENHKSEGPIEVLLSQCQTLDQCNLLVKFLDVLKKRTFHASVVATSPQGCGKSAALGLAIAGSLALNYSNIFVSSLCYDNVKVVFKFLFKGLDALGYKENDDYDVIESVNPEFKNVLIGLNIFRDHPQAVRFIRPIDVQDKLEQAELVIIDEAAAIPSQLLKLFVGSHIVLMSSTTSGYGAVGQNLYSNIVNTFGVATATDITMQDSTAVVPINSVFHKVTLSEPIHYSENDGVDHWLNQLLCLKPSVTPQLSFGCPHPEQCVLYYINRDALFSCSPTAEVFFHSLTSIFASSKKQNTGNYLMRMADAPDHHLFCLLPPSSYGKKSSPEILCAILVHIERKIPNNIVYCAVNQTLQLPLCLSDWSFATELEEEILSIPGVHILDLVTHPEFQRMGYGLKAYQLLQEFYEGKFISLDESPMDVSSSSLENSQSDSNSPDLLPLLNSLSQVQPEKVCYFFASYGLSPALLRFWKKAGFVCGFITKEFDSSAEHYFYMLKNIGNRSSSFNDILQENWRSFREYFFLLLSSECKDFAPALALSLLTCNNNFDNASKGLTKEDIDVHIKPRFMRSLEKYDENQKDLHCIMPIIPVMSKLYFRGCFKNVTLSYVQEAILLCMGLQHKTVDEITKDLNLPASQIYALLNRTIKRIRKHLTDIIERSVEKTIAVPSTILMEPLAQDLDQELEEAAAKIRMEIDKTKNLKDMKLSTYAIRGSEEEWQSALQSGRKTLVSIKSIKKTEDSDNFKSKHLKKTGKSKNKIGKLKKRK